MALDWDKLNEAMKMFKRPIEVSEGDWAIVDGVQFVYKNGEWVEKEIKEEDV